MEERGTLYKIFMFAASVINKAMFNMFGVFWSRLDWNNVKESAGHVDERYQLFVEQYWESAGNRSTSDAIWFYTYFVLDARENGSLQFERRFEVSWLH